MGWGLTVGFVGDVGLGRRTAGRFADHDPERALGGVADLLGEADLCFANLADALPPDPRADRRGAAAGAELLRRAGLAAVSVANGAIFDRGVIALARTLDALDEAGVGRAGAGADLREAERPARRARAGRRVSLLAFAARPAAWAAGPCTAGVRYLSLDEAGLARARAAVATERAFADVIVVSLHAGEALRARPDSRLRAFARQLVEAGADLVWGHGARRVQGVEWFGGRPVLYDAGELLVDAPDDAAGGDAEGAAFHVRVGRAGVSGLEVRPTRARDGRVEPLRGAGRDRWLARFAERCAELGTPVAVGEDRVRLVAPASALA